MLLHGLHIDPLLARLRRTVEGATGRQPTIDFALLALASTRALPEHAPFCLFLLGRSVGWAARAMEQISSGNLIRPRARYQGPTPEM